MQLGFEDIGVGIPETIEPDDLTPVQYKRQTMPGDLWALGEHRLKCGDATKRQDLDDLLGGEAPELMFADPPYGLKKECDGVTNDNLNRRDLLAFNLAWVPLSLSFLRRNASAYIWGMNEYLMDLYAFVLRPRILDKDLTFGNLIIWDKVANFGQLSPDMRCYSPASEECIFFFKGQQAYGRDVSTWNPAYQKYIHHLKDILKVGGMNIADATKITTTATGHYFSHSQYQFPTREAYETICKACGVPPKYDEIKAQYEKDREAWRDTRAYFDNTHDNMNNVWHFRRAAEVGEAVGHPPQKPVRLVERCLMTSSREGGAVLDPFGGSVSTIIAAENTGRRAYCLEIEPQWCDVILARYEKKTGKRPEKLHGGVKT